MKEKHLKNRHEDFGRQPILGLQKSNNSGKIVIVILLRNLLFEFTIQHCNTVTGPKAYHMNLYRVLCQQKHPSQVPFYVVGGRQQTLISGHVFKKVTRLATSIFFTFIREFINCHEFALFDSLQMGPMS